MDLRTLADTLVDCCRSQREAELLEDHYAEDAVSVEAMDGPDGSSAITEGREGIRAKHAWWNETFEVHGGTVDGPYLHGDDRFAVIFEADITNKATGERSQMKEVAIYTARDGRIVREEFFYTM